MHAAGSVSSLLLSRAKGVFDHKHPKVLITNPKIFEEKRRSFLQGGISKIQVRHAFPSPSPFCVAKSSPKVQKNFG
jgi:hypothetical protein